MGVWGMGEWKPRRVNQLANLHSLTALVDKPPTQLRANQKMMAIPSPHNTHTRLCHNLTSAPPTNLTPSLIPALPQITLSLPTQLSLRQTHTPLPLPLKIRQSLAFQTTQPFLLQLTLPLSHPLETVNQLVGIIQGSPPSTRSTLLHPLTHTPQV